MQFVSPMPFEEAVQKLGSKFIFAAPFDTEKWRETDDGIRNAAFFSARIESVRHLQEFKGGITDFLSGARETTASGETALKTGSRQQFVKVMQDMMERTGVERTTGGLTDITSERRLGLIFDTQVRMAQGYGDFKQGMDPDALDAFPAQRFIRVQDVQEPRSNHARFEGEVHLKTDTGFWSALNEDFGVPWPPFGFGCGHELEDVSREEAEALGLIEPGQTVAPVEKDFNERLQASTRGLDDDMIAKLKEVFGNQVTIEGDAVKWKGTSSDERPADIQRDRGPAGRDAQDASPADARRVGNIAEDVFRGIRSRDDGTPFPPAVARQAGAHFAAVAEGRKPLYHEQWGIEKGSDLARPLWGGNLPGVEVVLDSEGHIYAFNRAAVQAVIDRAPEQYPGVDLIDKIQRATREGRNGGLLGYGARTMLEPRNVVVDIVDAAGNRVFSFLSQPENAAASGAARAEDFARYLQRPFRAVPRAQ